MSIRDLGIGFIIAAVVVWLLGGTHHALVLFGIGFGFVIAGLVTSNRRIF